ncbi:MAG: hypothetical protein GWO02_14020, partial [Gammaproteobacteria bacterium]|nr:hypothetical protein [Gammaproteobacteria bacterium]
DNDRDYRLGDELRYDLYGMYQVRHDLVLQAQLNGSVQSAIEGEMDEAASGASGRVIPGDPSSPYATPTRDSDNYGGRWLFATVGLQWQPAPRHIIDFQVGMPLHRDLNGPQLETDYRVMLTWYVELPTSKSVRYRGERPNGASRLGF